MRLLSKTSQEFTLSSCFVEVCLEHTARRAPTIKRIGNPPYTHDKHVAWDNVYILFLASSTALNLQVMTKVLKFLEIMESY